jgi:hypothetical protein
MGARQSPEYELAVPEIGESMKISKHATILYEHEELFESRFRWIISKVLSGATLFFILAVASQWESF